MPPPTPRARRCLALVALAWASGCGVDESVGGQCPTGTSVAATTAEGRKLLGLAARYPADGMLASRAEALRVSQRARRAAAWEVVARVLAPVAVATPTPLGAVTVPTFRTWYDREDMYRVFQRAYTLLGAEGRAAQAPIPESALDDAFGWNARFLDTLDTWPASRWDAYVASVHDRPTLAGVAGLLRVALSPEAARHLAASYAEVLRCVDGTPPPALVDGPAATQRLAREPFSLPRCTSRAFGAYFVAGGASFTARVEGGDAARVTLRVVDADGTVRCNAAGDTGCALTGPGAFRVVLLPTATSARGVLEVRHAPPEAAAAGCLRGVFPRDAATVSMEWRRSDFGPPLPDYDTSAAGLRRRLANPTATWGEGDATATPTDDAIYTMFIPSGAVFQLTGMHIRTREVDRWMHITLWWSSQPDTDFGADRPASVRALGAPWDFYKMCVVTDFDEGDPDPDGGFARDAPSLAAALRAVHEGSGGPSWCSNPYIDTAPGLVRSNCIGCHQHAMSSVRPSDTVTGGARYPAAGRAQVRNNFPADQFWSLDRSEHFASIFAETVAWWRASPR